MLIRHNEQGFALPLTVLVITVMTLMIAMAVSIVLYIVVSLLCRTEFDMDRMLHRGKHAIKGESEDGGSEVSEEEPVKGFKALITTDFTTQDKWIYGIMLFWVVGWTLVFIAGTIYNLFVAEVSDETWAKFWYFKVWLACIVAAITAVWFFIGGLIDVKNMFKSLSSLKRNDMDAGMVIGHHNLGEEEQEQGDV